ncbi:glycosyltransferase [Hahella sp. SMD15-11]|uniref:Glycosyltransferase n=1 Tax=Thermohahella caldifontis TaxID=3142973 RepID=A0AB39USD7_9GAMM
MAILQLVTGLGVGGAERVVVELANELKRRGLDVHVISLNEDTEILEQYKDIEFPHKALSIAKTIKGFVHAFLMVNCYIRDKNINIIHAHMFHSLVLAVVLKFFNRNLKIVFTSHTFRVGGFVRVGFIKLTRSWRENDIVFSKKQHPHLNASPVIIKNSVKLKAVRHYKSRDNFTFLFLGRLETPKNPMAITDIVLGMKDETARFIVAGDGSLRQDLETKIFKEGLSSRIRVIGKVSDIDAVFSEVDCLILPSLWEGLPMVILEAGARGIPVVSTPVGAIPELINKSCGYLTALRDFPTILDKIVENPEEARKRGRKLRDILSHEYSLDQFVSKHLTIYEGLLSG